MSDAINHRWNHPAVILVATDLNDLDRLIPFAFQQVAATGARLILLHVIVPGSALTVDSSGLPAYNPMVALEFASKVLDPWCEMARSKNIVCDALLREGNVAEQIATSARQFSADRLLLGTRSKGKLERLFLGSVAEQVLRSVYLPVMTVGPEAHLPLANDHPERVVLHATTLREASRPSAALACQIAASQGAKLLLLHVLPPIDEPVSEFHRKGLPTGLDSAAMYELDLLAKEAGANCCTAVETYVVHGNPAIEILSEAVERHASLIVLGATQHSALQNLTRDRVVYRVLAHARCPVLTLGEPQSSMLAAQSESIATHS